MPSINSNRVRNKQNGNGSNKKSTHKKLPPKKREPRKLGQIKNPQFVRDQNKLRELLARVRPRSLKPVNEVGTGVDYIFSGIKFDRNFSFGMFGQGNIVVRVRNGELLNQSNWIMSVSRNGEIEFYKTSRLNNYIKRNIGSVQKNIIAVEEGYSKSVINLKEFFADEGVNPIKCKLTYKSVLDALKEVRSLEVETKRTGIPQAFLRMIFEKSNRPKRNIILPKKPITPNQRPEINRRGQRNQ